MRNRVGRCGLQTLTPRTGSDTRLGALTGVCIEYGGGGKDTGAQCTVLRTTSRLLVVAWLGCDREKPINMETEGADESLTQILRKSSWDTRHKYIIPWHVDDATNSPEGEKQTAVTPSSCCRCFPMGCPETASQKRTVLSKDALARIDPSGERERDSIQWV